MNETLYNFISRTLIWPEYRNRNSARDYEFRLFSGEEKFKPMEMSYVVNQAIPMYRIKEIIK